MTVWWLVLFAAVAATSYYHPEWYPSEEAMEISRGCACLCGMCVGLGYYLFKVGRADREFVALFVL